MKKILLCLLSLVFCASVWGQIQNNQIIYTASAQLRETTDGNVAGLHTDAFNTSITSHEFADGTGIIAFNKNVTSVGDDAFRGSGITSISIPASVKNIGAFAFESCSSLTSITVPASVTSIGTNTFEACTSLTTVTIEDGCQLETINDGAFLSSGITFIAIPSTVKTIGDGAFQDCASLCSVVFAENSWLQSIGVNAFSGSGITSITIPASVTVIGKSAFYDCSSLSSVAFAEGSLLQTIGAEAFDGSVITSITIPATVTGIGDFAFSYCSSLSSVVFADNSLLQTIGNYVFSGCSVITSITIPASVTGIDYGAFYNCSSLSSVAFAGNSLQSIGPSAFENSGITSITIPADVTVIGRGTFNNCTSLSSVTFLSPTPETTTIGQNAFYAINLQSVYVPAGKETTYQNAYSWSNGVTIYPLSVTLNEAGFATYSSPADLKIATEGVSAWKASVTGETITLTELNGYIPAGTGVLLYKENGADTDVEFTGATGTAADVTGNALQPTTTPTSTLVSKPDNVWVLGDSNQFLHYTGQSFIPSRAYLIHGAQSAPLRMSFDDATFVAPVRQDMGLDKILENGQIIIIRNGQKYNLAGQKL